jgi:hypothetical protein
VVVGYQTRRKGVKVSTLWKRRKQKAGIKYPTTGMSLVDETQNSPELFANIVKQRKMQSPTAKPCIPPSIVNASLPGRTAPPGQNLKLINGKLRQPVLPKS